MRGSRTHGPWRRVVDHDGVREVDVAVGALEVGSNHLALDVFPGYEVVLVGICKRTIRL